MLSLKKLLNKILHCVYTTGTSNGWVYKKYADGTFEATRISYNGGTGGNMTQLGTSDIYYSVVSQIAFPAIGITEILSIDSKCAPPANYLMDFLINRLTTSAVYVLYVRYGSGAGVTNITWSMRITGTWA